MDGSHGEHKRLNAILAAGASARGSLRPSYRIMALELAAWSLIRHIEADNQFAAIEFEPALYENC